MKTIVVDQYYTYRWLHTQYPGVQFLQIWDEDMSLIFESQIKPSLIITPAFVKRVLFEGLD